MNRLVPDRHDTSNRSRWAQTLFGLFLFAVFMGPGPGIYLVNPHRGAPTTLLNVPIVYLWAVGWFVVMAGVILTAYHVLWKQDGN